ncbi:hypothetical protein, partial [Bacillus thuringiensis]|uniref:hypothetical protein n=1 Tax=Bacillus thuringiensis TaxID=1428 RepID=UPI001C92BAAE
MKYVVGKDYELVNGEVDLDQVIRATNHIQSLNNFLPHIHPISQKTIHLSNQLSNELNLENNIQHFKEPLHQVIR